MPDADIPPVVLTSEEIATIQAEVPKLPPDYRADWAELGVDKSVINKILSHQSYAQTVSAVIAAGSLSDGKRVANWIASNLSADETASGDVANVDDLLALSEMTGQNEITSNAATELFNALMQGATDPRRLAEERNLLQTSDEDAIAAIVDTVLADPASAKAVADIQAGSDKAIGFLVGQVMKLSQGKANPAMAQKLIRERL